MVFSDPYVKTLSLQASLISEMMRTAVSFTHSSPGQAEETERGQKPRGE